MVEIFLLGPPAIARDGQRLPLPVRKAMTLVAFLAIERSLRRDELAERMWPGLDAASARRNLRRELARLRDAGLREAIEADDEHIGLAASVRVDVDEFVRGVADGDAAALALWRGPFATDLATSADASLADWIDAHRARLAGLRRQALERAADAAEAAGDARAALVPLQAALADDPLQERLHRRVIGLLAGLGEREQALAQFERCRQLLADELGISPLQETEALARALREPGAPAAAGPPTGPVATGSAASPDSVLQLPMQLPFVGRGAEIEQLDAGWGGHRCIVIVGAGGVGKSRLAADFVAARAPHLVVACRAGDEGVAHRSASRWLRALVAAGGWPADDWVRSELARLLPEAGPAPPPLVDETQSLRFLDAMAHAVSTLAADNFAALLVDDLHVADAASAALIGHVAERLSEGAAEGHDGPRLVLTMREGEGGAALAALVARLVASGVAARIRLAPLAEGDVLDLVRRLSGAKAPSRFAARLHGATAGNAFFVHETLRHLVATGWLTAGEGGLWQTPFDERTSDYAELPLPSSVFEATAARVDRGGDAMRRVLEAASLAGEPFASETLAGATALSALELADALERAEEMQLVVASGGAIRFAHDLVRQSLAARLSVQRRRLLHEHLAAAAERAGAEPATVGEHWSLAGQPARAVAWWLRAADRAAERWGDVDAIALNRRALEAGASGGHALTAQQALAKLHLRRNEVEPAVAAATAALALAESNADPDTAALAAASLADIEVGMHRAAAGSTRLDELAGRPGLLPATRARIELSRCEAWRQQGRHDEAREAALALLALLDGDIGSPGSRPADPRVADALRRDAHAALGALAFLGVHLHEGIGHAQEMRAACARLGDRTGIGGAERMLGVMLLNLHADRTSARFHLEAARRIAAEERDVNGERVTILNLIKIAADAGDCDEVMALAQAGWNLSPRFARAMVRQAFHFAFLYVHLLQGELGSALDRAATIRSESEGSGEFLVSSLVAEQLADLYLCVGDAATVHALLDAVPPATVAGNHGLRLTEVRAAAHLLTGELDAARTALEGWSEDDSDLSFEARTRLRLQRAEVLLRAHRTEDAARELAAISETSNRELAMTTAALRLRVGATVATIDEARSLLGDGRAPVSFMLDLRIALVAALAAAGLDGEAARERAVVDAELARLVATLGSHAERRAAVLARYPVP